MASPKDHSGSNCFHQTIELHLDYGSDILRRVLEKKLQDQNISLQDHLQKPAVLVELNNSKKKGYLHYDQWNLLFPGQNQEPNVSELDITLLTYLLLQTYIHLTKSETKIIKELRTKRNQISHVPKAELKDKTNFNSTRHLLLKLSKNVLGPKTAEGIEENIDGILKRKEFLSCRSSFEIMKIRNEELMVKLVDRPAGQTDDISDTTCLRFNLTKWAKQFIRDIDLDTLLCSLKEKCVISQTEKADIENEYNKEEQSTKLIMKIVEETNERLWEFCRCLRQINGSLADLIENRNTDGADIDSNLRANEKEKIRRIIRTYFQRDKGGSVPCEEIHIVVEHELQYIVEYSLIEEIFLEEFQIDGSRAGDYRFHGVASNNIEDIKRRLTSPYKNRTGDGIEEEEDGESMSEMSSDTLAEHACKRLEKIQPLGPKYGPKMKNAINLECITPKLFVNMTAEEIKHCFSDYLEGMPFGILKELIEMQQELKKRCIRNFSGLVDPLRKFDVSAEGKCYEKGPVRPTGGHLMVPAHEFKTLPASGEFTNPFIVKESIKFIAACVNTRKNGTIHFGIKRIGNGCGTIIGLEKVSELTSKSLDTDIMKSIETCFRPDHALLVQRCVRPLQVVPVEDGSVVLELDVNPFSGYLASQFFPVLFPPKGKQDKKLFVYNNESQCEIMTVPSNKQEEVMMLYEKNIKERISLEAKNKRVQSNNDTMACSLVESLTGGSDYVTDQYTPIICTGRITGCENEDDIRKSFDIPEAFLSSVATFDFDSSVRLRKLVEKQDTVFRVVTATKNIPDESIFAGSEKLWMYCNGNLDLNIEEMELKEWYKDRFNIVREALHFCKQKTPAQRAIVIFFAFGKTNLKDPMLELAEECIKSEFRNQCVIIAESEEVVTDLRKRLFGIMPVEDVQRYFHIGMKWEEISNTIRTVFRTCTQFDNKLPCSNGHFILMTSEEKRQLNFSDIEILSGEQCKSEEMLDNDESRRKRKLAEQENFYKGRDVSWWNFYYADQVGKRDLHAKYLQSVRRKLKSEGGKLIEIKVIQHQPGAGGSTAGRYLLWHLSQFEGQGSENAYRCCVIKQITENTGKEIYSFLSFKDISPKPVVVLADNVTDENLRILTSQLDEQAYKYGEANKLFCLLIKITRVPVSFKQMDAGKVLKHELSNAEQSWFESKYKELEKTNGIDVRTLISFNVMKNNFEQEFIQKLADQILRGVTNTEKDVLKCLSLVNTYDRENIIPISTFDCLMTQTGQLPGHYNLWDLKNKGPVGLVVSMIGQRNISNARNLWNVDMTDELALLIKKGSDNVIQSGVMIISQALANAIFGYMKEQNLTLEDLIHFVLSIVKIHVREKNPMSKHFVKIINGLFKTRQILTRGGEIKSKFSDMIMALLQRQKKEEESDANNRVVNAISQCFDITADAMVGQQLARFFIHMKEFQKAEEVILKSLDLQPNSSYLLDTHGQIYRSKMETLIEEKGSDINDEDAAQIIESAFMAINKFVQAEECAITSMEKEGDINNSCFYMEVKTALILLEKFTKFSCHVDRNNLLTFLNNPDYDISMSSFKQVARQCPLLKELRKNSETQKHIGDSLRMLEEREYQVKRRFYIVNTPPSERLLLNLRERFECFYGTDEERSKLQFLYGIGLKSLMQADLHEKEKLLARVIEAKSNLQHHEKTRLKTVDKRDLLVLLGFEIIRMSKSKSSQSPMKVEDYQLLLRYSEKLLELESCSSRPYLEAYLYYAILHWPSPSRLGKDSLRGGYLCKPAKYTSMLCDWKKAFERNFEIKSYAEQRKNVPKNYFVLGKGDIGRDIVDLECIRSEWKIMKRKTENRKKPPVKADNFWKEDFVVERLQRLTGILDDCGKTIHYEHKNDLWMYSFSIRTYYPSPYLSNRRVTFVLGFTWADLAAFDVEEADAPRSICPLSTSRGEDDATVAAQLDKKNFVEAQDPPYNTDIDEKETELVDLDDIASESDSSISCDENAYIDSQSEPEEIIYGAVGGYDTVSDPQSKFMPKTGTMIDWQETSAPNVPKNIMTKTETQFDLAFRQAYGQAVPSNGQNVRTSQKAKHKSPQRKGLGVAKVQMQPSKIKSAEELPISTADVQLGQHQTQTSVIPKTTEDTFSTTTTVQTNVSSTLHRGTVAYRMIKSPNMINRC